MMKQDETQAAAILIAFMLGYVFYKIRLYELPFEDYFGVVIVTIAVPYFLYLFLRSRFG